MKKYISTTLISIVVFYFTECIQNKKEEKSATKIEKPESVPFEPAILYTQFIKKAKEKSPILRLMEL